MKHQKGLLKFVNLLIAFSLLLMAAGCTPETINPNQPQAVPRPEPPILVVALPIEYQQLLAEYGPYEVASASLAPARVPADCNNLFTHGLRSKRLNDFASHGISVAALFEAISTGQAVIERAGISDANGASLGVLISFGAHKVFMIFGGGITKPTIYPLPWISKGETMKQALDRIFDPVRGTFKQSVEVTAALQQSVRQLAGCVKGLIDKHSVDSVPQGAPEAEPAPEPIPVPAGTPQAEEPGASADKTNSFASTDPDLLNLSPEEVQLLILLGVVVVVAVVVVVVASGGTAALPLVALAAI